MKSPPAPIRPANTLVLANAASNYARFAISIVCTFILTPHLLHALGAEDYGRWTLALCIAGYLELFDFGLTAGAMRFVARMGPQQPEQKNRLVNTLIVTALGIIPLVILTGCLLVGWMDSGSQLQSISEQDSMGGNHAMNSMSLLVLLVTLRVIVIVPCGILMGVLFGEHRIWLVNLVRTIAISVFTAIAYVAIAMGGNVVSLGIVYASVYSLEYVAYGILAARLVPWFRINLTCFELASLREVAGFSSSVLTANASNVALMRTDPFIVTTFLSLGAVAFYAVPMRIAEQLFTLSKQLINVFSPLFAQLHGQGDSDSVQASYITCTKYAVALMIGIVSPAVFYSSEALALWLGEQFVDCRPILVILLLAAVVRTLQESSANVLAMTGMHVFIARMSIANAVANLLLSLVLVQFMGLIGVALATLIAVTVFGGLLPTLRACRTYQIGMAEFAKRTFAPALLPTLAQLTILTALRILFVPSSMLMLAFLGIVSVMSYAGTFLLVSLSAAERDFIAARWIAFWSRIRHSKSPADPVSESSHLVRKEPC